MTTKLQSALADAQSLAVGKDHNYIEPVHLISVLLDQQGKQPGADAQADGGGCERPQG